MTSTQIDMTTKSPNPPMHVLQKSFFYNQNLNLWGKHLQKMTCCNKYGLTIHARLNLSFVMYMVECLSLTAYINERNNTF